MLLPTAFSIPELIWTISAIIGLFAGAYNIWVSRHQLRAVRRRGITNGKRIIAVGRFTRDMLRMAIQGLYMAAGIAAGYIEPGPEPSTGQSIVWMLVATSILVTISTMTDAVERYWTLHLQADTRSERDMEEDKAFGIERRALEVEHIEEEAGA